MVLDAKRMTLLREILNAGEIVPLMVQALAKGDVAVHWMFGRCKTSLSESCLDQYGAMRFSSSFPPPTSSSLACTQVDKKLFQGIGFS